MATGLRTDLYMLTEQELIQLVVKECEADGIEYKMDELGNIWSITRPDSPIFVAHQDTVIGADENYKKPLKIFNNELSRPGYVLGGDCRAGVNCILNHKHAVNWVLTVQEECGCIGANALAKNSDFIADVKNANTFFIELDRRNGGDILGTKHGYCEQELSDAIADVLIGYTETTGVFTDIDAWTKIAQGVNLSVGYYNAHSNKEYLDIDEWEYINSMIIQLAKIEGFGKTYDKPKAKFQDYYGYSKYDWGKYDNGYGKYFEDEYMSKCSFCGSKEYVMDEFLGQSICDACASTLSEKDKTLLDSVLEIKDDSPETNCKCANCGYTLLDDDDFVEVPDWNLMLCNECVNLYMGGKKVKW